MWPAPPEGTCVIDLDGVVWLSGRLITGVEEALAHERPVGLAVTARLSRCLVTLLQEASSGEWESRI